MSLYRKKPVIIEAKQFTGTNSSEILSFVAAQEATWLPQEKVVIIKTLEGDHTASIGDWIIRGVKGEFYPCKPDIFELTYESVDGPVDAPDEIPF